MLGSVTPNNVCFWLRGTIERLEQLEKITDSIDARKLSASKRHLVKRRIQAAQAELRHATQNMKPCESCASYQTCSALGDTDRQEE
jgi:hypothetical protein